MLSVDLKVKPAQSDNLVSPQVAPTWEHRSFCNLVHVFVCAYGMLYCPLRRTLVDIAVGGGRGGCHVGRAALPIKDARSLARKMHFLP